MTKIYTQRVPFFSKKKFWARPRHDCNVVATCWYVPDNAKLWKRKKKKERIGFLTNASLFLLVLWFDLCGVLSWSRSTTTKPPLASSDPKAPSLSLSNWSLFKFWVFSLFWHFLSLFLFSFLFFLVGLA